MAEPSNRGLIPGAEGLSLFISLYQHTLAITKSGLSSTILMETAAHKSSKEKNASVGEESTSA